MIIFSNQKGETLLKEYRRNTGTGEEIASSLGIDARGFTPILSGDYQLAMRFESDPEEDQFMFGPDILVAPVLTEGSVSRKVYLPVGPSWTDANTGQIQEGGQWIEAATPLESLGVFLKDGTTLTGDIFA
jgi:hypothetical protein